MSPSLHRRIARLTLALMLLTFLSPSFGWEMVAGHVELGCKATASAPASPCKPQPHEHVHEDAHTMVGHMLGFIPVNVADVLQQVLPRHRAVRYAAASRLRVPASPPDQPYRPPNVPVA